MIRARVLSTVLEGKPHPRNNTSPLLGRACGKLGAWQFRASQKSERKSTAEIACSANGWFCADFAPVSAPSGGLCSNPKGEFLHVRPPPFHPPRRSRFGLWRPQP